MCIVERIYFDKHASGKTPNAFHTLATLSSSAVGEKSLYLSRLAWRNLKRFDTKILSSPIFFFGDTVALPRAGKY